MRESINVYLTNVHLTGKTYIGDVLGTFGMLPVYR